MSFMTMQGMTTGANVVSLDPSGAISTVPLIFTTVHL